MAEVKCTPGDWTFDNRSLTGAVWAGKEFVASVYPNAPEGWDGFGDYERLDEMRANARLIAAAPDHHAVALELDRLMLVIDSAVRFADPAHKDEVKALLRANRAALSKATAQQEGR